ncbi:MAG: hypothetical protein KGK10_11580, partial [Rhodospirillales bacterium]|nr:hypothetical protein [Rhodospirillales bacterium]
RISILYALKHDTRRDQSCRIESLPHATDSLADQGTAHANFSKIESEPKWDPAAELHQRIDMSPGISFTLGSR